MNGRPLTDAQLSRALRAHLPEAATPGLRERVFDAVETTGQLRSFPSLLGALTEADPVARRRSMLIAAALLLAVAVASAAAVGAWHLLQRDPNDELSLEPPADVPAFVLSSYERLPQLPPVALTWRDSDSTKGRIYVDRSGAVRFDRFTSAEAAEPASYMILSPDHRISGMAPVESEPVWVEQGHEAIGEDPRVFLRTVLSADEGPGCEMERDPSDVGNDTVAGGWQYVGLENVAGRPTHHVACAGDLWIDIETRLILRTQGPAVDDAGQPIPVEFTEVTEIAFGEQPAALFEPPAGVTRMSAEDYSAYICARDLPNEIAPGISDCPSTEEPEATPPPDTSPTPMHTERADTSNCAVPSSDPSEPIGPLAWTPASLNADWPAQVRPEPAGGGSVQPMPIQYFDPMGDTGSDLVPCVDIRWVTADASEVRLKLDSSQPAVDPAERWIAYGVVTDDDRDGVPDWRYGIDNVPFGNADASGDPSPRRWWRTDLHTGRTYAGGMGGGDADWLGADFKSTYPRDSDEAAFLFSGAMNTPQGSSPWGFELDTPFYTWASVIVDGRVVATDFAPDGGWLVATPGVWHGGTFLLADPFPNLSMIVPEGWTTSGSGLRRVACGDLGRHVGPDEYFRADCARVEFAVIGDPLEWVDPCDNTIEAPQGSGFDDFVTCVASRGREGNPYGGPIITSEDVTVDGYRGKHFEYSPQTRSGGCPYDCGDVWILDVDGVLLMIGSLPTGDLDGDVPEEAVKAEIRQMVESIHFER
jgi:hypothetical protein